VVGGPYLAGDEKEAAATLGPRQDGVLGREGVKFQTEMGAGGGGMGLLLGNFYRVEEVAHRLGGCGS
jgi:hypothetical protein